MQASCAPRVAAIMAAVCGTQRTASGLLARGEEDPEPASIEPLPNAVGQRPWRASRRHRLRARGYAAGNGAAPEFLQFTKSNSPDR
jgi:hypothetical protein